MRRVVGFALFFVAIGMTIMLILSNDFLGFLMICVLLLLGYYLFCCE